MRGVRDQIVMRFGCLVFNQKWKKPTALVFVPSALVINSIVLNSLIMFFKTYKDWDWGKCSICRQIEPLFFYHLSQSVGEVNI